MQAERKYGITYLTLPDAPCGLIPVEVSKPTKPGNYPGKPRFCGFTGGYRDRGAKLGLTRCPPSNFLAGRKSGKNFEERQIKAGHAWK